MEFMPNIATDCINPEDKRYMKEITLKGIKQTVQHVIRGSYIHKYKLGSSAPYVPWPIDQYHIYALIRERDRDRERDACFCGSRMSIIRTGNSWKMIQCRTSCTREMNNDRNDNRIAEGKGGGGRSVAQQRGEPKHEFKKSKLYQ